MANDVLQPSASGRLVHCCRPWYTLRHVQPMTTVLGWLLHRPQALTEQMNAYDKTATACYPFYIYSMTPTNSTGHSDPHKLNETA